MQSSNGRPLFRGIGAIEPVNAWSADSRQVHRSWMVRVERVRPYGAGMLLFFSQQMWVSCKAGALLAITALLTAKLIK